MRRLFLFPTDEKLHINFIGIRAFTDPTFFTKGKTEYMFDTNVFIIVH